jgi:hypothetical protein
MSYAVGRESGTSRPRRSPWRERSSFASGAVGAAGGSGAGDGGVSTAGQWQDGAAAVMDQCSGPGCQVLAAGLIDEVRMDVVPVVFGSGKRYFGSVHAQHLLEDPDVVIQGNRVLHLRYRVRR